MDASETRLTGALHVSGADGSDPAGTPPTQRATAADALLRQVPDDPGGLLRERFMLQYLRRHGQLY
jgi:Ca-activated chloride channel family protein